jgi:hypothetical protein
MIGKTNFEEKDGLSRIAVPTIRFAKSDGPSSGRFPPLLPAAFCRATANGAVINAIYNYVFVICIATERRPAAVNSISAEAGISV